MEKVINAKAMYPSDIAIAGSIANASYANQSISYA